MLATLYVTRQGMYVCVLGEGLNFIMVFQSIRAVVQSLVMGATLFRQRSQDNFYSLYSFFLLHFVGIPVPRDGGRHEPFFFAGL